MENIKESNIRDNMDSLTARFVQFEIVESYSKDFLSLNFMKLMKEFLRT